MHGAHTAITRPATDPLPLSQTQSMPRSTASPLARPSPASAVAASTPRHQPASPSRQARARTSASHAAVPGIITLPQSSKHLSSRSSSPRSSRPQLPPPPQPEPTALAKPADIVNGAAIAGQTKRRNREKKSTHTTDSPLKHATAPEEAVLDVAATVAPDSPTKSSRKRRGGRAARQPSPPMPPTADANLFAAPPPPPTSSSRSLGQDTTTRSAHYNALLNVEDEWDMPVLHISGNQQQQDKSLKPKESLSWQQELLRAGSNNSSSSTTARNGNNGSPVSRPRSRVQPAKDLRPAPMTSNNNSAGRSRPALTTSHSDSFPSTSSSSSSLNWQQELLLRTDEVQLVQQVTATTTTSTATAVTSVTPARQRRNQIKDSITFGIATLDLAAASETDVFSNAPASSNRRQKRAVAPQGVVDNLVATPTKSAAAVEPRYAGPTFHNSPAPSALPMPSFMLRRQAVETVVATH